MSLRERCALVVPTVKAGATLAAALDSVGPAWRRRALVIDNGPPTQAPGRGGAGRGEVTVIAMGGNRGFAAAVNAGIRVARQRGDEFLVLVNDDVVVDAASLDRLVATLHAQPRAASAAGVLLQPDGELVDTAGIQCDRALGAQDVGRHRRLGDLATGARPLGPSGGLAAYRLSALREAGDFDEGFFAYYEDVDIALRLRARGWQCILEPRTIGIHLGSATLGWRSIEKAVTVGRSRGRIVRKYGAHRQVRAWPWLALELAAGLLLSIEHRSPAPIRARYQGFRDGERVLPYPGELVDAAADRHAVMARITRRYRRVDDPGAGRPPGR